MKRILSATLLCLIAIAVFAQGGTPAGEVPAYHKAAPSKGDQLPPILTREQLVATGMTQPVQLHAYEIAAKIPKVLYQQPCYCHCDRSVGHTSLHSCFASDHGARCGTCMAEAYYAYQMTKKGKTPAQIRAGIERGEWEKVDLRTAASIN